MSSKKKQDSSIHFVNARPSSETEKKKIHRLVRAHVGRWISEQTKDRSNVPESSDRDDPNGPKAPMTVVEEDTLSSASSATSSSRASPASTNTGYPPSDRSRSLTDCDPSCDWQHTSLVPYDNNNSNTNNSPLSPSPPTEHLDYTGCGVLDPFNTYPSSFSPELVHACEEYCLSVLWPALTPGAPNGLESAAISSWFPLSLQDPTLFTAFLFGALSHKQVQWTNRWAPADSFGPRERRALHMCEFESIKLINKAVQDPARAVSDAVILSVLCMAHNRADEHVLGAYRSSPFPAPLQRLQWIDVYASLPQNPVHAKGLVQLVMLKGGLEHITLPGAAPILCLSDILTASTYVTQPIFSFIPLQKQRKGLSLHALLGFTPCDVENGFGQLRSIGLTLKMAEVFQAMRVYTTVVEDYLDGTLHQPDLSLIIDQRNFTQYSLMSLAPANQLDGTFSQQGHHIVYEASRLAGIIFGVGVVFPLPGQTTPLTSLSGLVQTVLRNSTSLAIWSSFPARVVLVWILTLGGIAATGTPERAWFVRALSQAAKQMGLCEWPDLKGILTMMLWYDRACDQPGQALWLEIERCICTSPPPIFYHHL